MWAFISIQPMEYEWHLQARLLKTPQWALFSFPFCLLNIDDDKTLGDRMPQDGKIILNESLYGGQFLVGEDHVFLGVLGNEK